jgi:hypothetical protein
MFDYPILPGEPYDLGAAILHALRKTTPPSAPPAGPRAPRPSEEVARPAEFPHVPGVFWSGGAWHGLRGYTRKRFSLTAYGTYAAAWEAACAWVGEG